MAETELEGYEIVENIKKEEISSEDTENVACIL